MTRWRADALLLLTAALWGFAFIMQKSAMSALGPLSFIAARAIIASIVLAPLAWMECRKANSPAPVGLLQVTAGAALALFAGASLQQIGLITATVTNGSFLTALYAVVVPFVAWIASGRAPPPSVWAAAAVSVIGVWLLGGAGYTPPSSGDLLVAASAIFWAVHIVISAKASGFGRPFLFTASQFAGLGILAAVAAAVYEQPTAAAFWMAGPEIAYVGIISTALTFTIFTMALRYVPPSEAAIILSSESLFASLAGALLLNERLGALNALGAALILAAILFVQTRAYRRDRRQTAA